MNIVFILVVLIISAGLFGIHFLESRNTTSGRSLTDSEALFLLARTTETSEFEQFRYALKRWRLPEDRVENDFNRYLLEGELPYYVRDYLRKAKDSNPELQAHNTEFFNGILLTKDQDESAG